MSSERISGISTQRSGLYMSESLLWTWSRHRGGCSRDIKVICIYQGYSISHMHSKIWLHKRDIHLSGLITCLNKVKCKKKKRRIPLNDTIACWIKLLLTRTVLHVCVCSVCAVRNLFPFQFQSWLSFLYSLHEDHRHGLTDKAARAKCTSSWNLWQMKIVEEGKKNFKPTPLLLYNTFSHQLHVYFGLSWPLQKREQQMWTLQSDVTQLMPSKSSGLQMWDLRVEQHYGVYIYLLERNLSL